MPEVVAKPPIESRVVHPALEPALDFVQVCLAQLDDIVDEHQRIFATEERRTKNQDILELSGKTVHLNEQTQKSAKVISTSAMSYAESPATTGFDGLGDEYPSVDDTATAGRVSLLSIVTAKRVELQLEGVGDTGLAPATLFDVEAIDFATELALSRLDNEPMVSSTEAKQMLGGFEEIHEAVSAYLTPGQTSLSAAECAERLGELPSMPTLDFLMLAAYSDVIRALSHDRTIGSTSFGERNERFRKAGVSETYILQLQAAQTFDFANPSTFDLAGDTMKMASPALVMVSPSEAWLADKLFVNALETMIEVVKASKKISYCNQALKAIHTGFRDTFVGLPANLEENMDLFYENLHFVGFSDDIPEMVLQALELEAYFIDALKEAVDAFSYDIMTERAAQQIKNSLEPRLANYLNEVERNKQLVELEGYFEEQKAEIQKLDSNYRYTSKKIRSFDGGPDMARKLGDALGASGMLRDEGLYQTLSILMLQAQNAPDRAEYFEQLRADRNAMEKILGDMQYLGMSYHTELVEVMRWLDEAIDAESWEQVRHAKFRDFVMDYYVGPDAEQLPVAVPIEETETVQDIETVVEPLDEEPEVMADKQDADDAPSSDQEAVQEENLQPQPEAELKQPEPESEPEEDPEILKKRTIDAYLGALSGMLEGVNVEFSDKEVFKPAPRSATERKQDKVSTSGEKVTTIDPSRLSGLVELKRSFEAQGKSARLIFTRPTAWSYLPYLVLYVQDDASSDTGVALFENPVIGHASYVATVDGGLIQGWEEVADMSRTQAQELKGSVSVFEHPTRGARTFGQHFEVILRQHFLTELYRLRKLKSA